jgi:hypothetical protein
MKALMLQKYELKGLSNEYKLKARDIYRYHMTYTEHFESYKLFIQELRPALNKNRGARSSNVLINDIIAVVKNTGAGLAGSNFSNLDLNSVVYTKNIDIFNQKKGNSSLTFQKSSDNYEGVKGTDINNDGIITVGEVAKRYLKTQNTYLEYDVPSVLGRI